MRTLLMLFFLGVLLAMLFVTIRASLHTSVLDVPAIVLEDPWFQATLVDAYCGFLTFYVWVFYREPSWLARGLWLIAILLLGNIAMAVYALIQLSRFGGRPLESLLLRPTEPFDQHNLAKNKGGA